MRIWVIDNWNFLYEILLVYIKILILEKEDIIRLNNLKKYKYRFMFWVMLN